MDGTQYIPLNANDLTFDKTFIAIENFEPEKLVSESLNKKNKLKNDLTNILPVDKINEIKEIIKEGNEKCKLLKQLEQENVILLTFKDFVDQLKKTISNFQNDRTIEIINSIKLILVDIKEIKDGFGLGEQYLVKDNCEAPSFSITKEDSSIYQNIHSVATRILQTGQVDLIEYIEDNLQNESEVILTDEFLLNNLLPILGITTDFSDFNNNINTLKDEEIPRFRDNFNTKVKNLNKKLNKLGIKNFDLPREINFEKPSILNDSISSKIEEVEEIIITTDTTIQYLSDQKSGIENVENFDANVRKIVEYLNLQSELIPIVNTYSKPFIELKRRLQDVLDKLKNSNDVNVSENEDMIRKKAVLMAHQSDIKMLDNMLNELKQSSDYVLDRYTSLVPKPKEETVDDITESLGAEAPMFTVEGK